MFIYDSSLQLYEANFLYSHSLPKLSQQEQGREFVALMVLWWDYASSELIFCPLLNFIVQTH